MIGEVMGHGRLWAEGLMSLETYLQWQFWAAAFVCCACLPQLHYGRKFRWPPEPGSLTILGGWLGFWLTQRIVRVPWLWPWLLVKSDPRRMTMASRITMALVDIGACLDFAATIIARLGIALQAVVAVFCIDDVMANPAAPRPLVTWLLISVVMVQIKALTAYSPRGK